MPTIITWLQKHDVPYDEIIIGKPWCGYDGFYVDDKAIRPSEFISLNYEQIKELLKKKTLIKMVVINDTHNFCEIFIF